MPPSHAGGSRNCPSASPRPLARAVLLNRPQPKLHGRPVPDGHWSAGRGASGQGPFNGKGKFPLPLRPAHWWAPPGGLPHRRRTARAPPKFPHCARRSPHHCHACLRPGRHAALSACWGAAPARVPAGCARRGRPLAVTQARAPNCQRPALPSPLRQLGVEVGRRGGQATAVRQARRSGSGMHGWRRGPGLGAAATVRLAATPRPRAAAAGHSATRPRSHSFLTTSHPEGAPQISRQVAGEAARATGARAGAPARLKLQHRAQATPRSRGPSGASPPPRAPPPRVPAAPPPRARPTPRAARVPALRRHCRRHGRGRAGGQ
jgi:hypothetical protein